MIQSIDFASDAPALLVEGKRQVVSYRELGTRVAALRAVLSHVARPALAFSFAPNGVDWVVFYLACLAEKIPLGLGDPAVASRDRVLTCYRPTVILLGHGDLNAPVGYTKSPCKAVPEFDIWFKAGCYEAVPHHDLALMLSTSGSTGDAKFVRLSTRNLVENARSIAEYLQLGSSEIAAQSLPLHYSYGLSVLNSHLLVGAAVMLTGHSFMRPEFWSVLDEAGCTSFAGVPYMYETLYRLKIDPTGRPKLRTITQAGGHLKVELVRHFHATAQRNQARLFVMYGQTEATARMAYVPPEQLEKKAGSIGVAIPRGEFWLEPIEGETNVTQLHYRGPNVMLGYATAPADLARNDELGGILATGDMAEIDADGFIKITGRLARFAKLFGKRINLASVESEIEAAFPVRSMAVDGGETMKVFLDAAEPGMAASVRFHLASWLGVPPVAFKVEAIGPLPLTPSGKKNYRALQ